MLSKVIGIFQTNTASKSMYSQVERFLLRLCFFSFVRVNFYEQLSALIKADIALYDALILMQAKYLEHKTIFKSYWLERKILADMIYRIDCGFGTNSLSELLDGLVPDSDLVILAVDSRKTIVALEKVIQMMEKFNKLRIEVLKMFFTPVSSLIMMLILIFVANAFVFPILIRLKPINELPASTYDLYVFCHFFAQHMISIMLSFVVFSILVVRSLSTCIGRFRNILDKIPPYSIYKQLSATSFLISLSMLLESGDDFVSAVQKIKKNASNYLNYFLNEIDFKISLGERSGQALAATNLFTKNTQIYIEILDEARALSEGITSLTDRSVEMQIRSIKRLLSTLSTILLFLVINFGLWFYVAVGNVGLSL